MVLKEEVPLGGFQGLDSFFDFTVIEGRIDISYSFTRLYSPSFECKLVNLMDFWEV